MPSKPQLPFVSDRNGNGVPVMPYLGGSLPFVPGNIWHVRPRTGSDVNSSGRRPDSAFKTLRQALSAAVANQNDVILFYGEGNASAYCTDYQNATLNWNKDLVHLIGVNSGVTMSPRSRISLVSTYDTASNLFTLSANGCLIRGIQFFEGVAGTNPTGAVKVTGTRNRFENCHFAGVGNAANDIAGAYSLKLDGAEENEFFNCTIGLQTMAAGAALNADLLFDSAAKNNKFENCLFLRQVSHASNHVLVEVADATGIDGLIEFLNCKFLYQSANYAVGATGVMRIPALTQGYLLVDERCGTRSDAAATTIKWDVNDNNKIILLGAATPAADTTGVGRLV